MASSPSGRSLRLLALGIGIMLVGIAGLAALPTARAAFQDLTVAPGRYTGTNLYVPGETMAITVTATAGEVYDIEIFHWPPFGTRTTRERFDNEAILASGQRTVTWLVPASMEDSPFYWVGVFGPNWFESSSAAPCGVFGCDVYLFEIRGYDFSAWIDRSRYVPGDTVTVGWSATLAQDGSPAPDGDGEIQAYNGPSSLLPAPHTFAASQGSFSFPLRTSEDPNRDPFVIVWFNDTSGNRRHTRTIFFDIGFLDAILDVDPIYAPEAVVTVDVWAKAAPSPGTATTSSPGVADAFVNVTITDVATGGQTPYSALNLRTGADGRVSHVFQLAATPAQAVYDVQVRVTAYGSLTASEADTFEVRSTPRLLLQLTMDRGEYASGETARATAATDPSGPNYTYTWRVSNAATGSILFQQSTGSAILDFKIPTNFTGALAFRVDVNDGQGTEVSESTVVTVAYGYLTVTLDRAFFDAGDTIAASVGLRSLVIANPTYFYEVRDGAGNLMDSGNLTGTLFTYRTPDPASSVYTFLVTASEGGRTVVGSASSVQAAFFVLSVATDRTTYLVGETVRIAYSITGRGPVAWPAVFRFSVNLLGSTATVVTTTSRSGEFGLRIPEGTNEGNLLLLVTEGSTGATAVETIHVGPTNPLWWSDVAGIPTFAVILAILVALLFVGFIYLWRKVTVGGMAPGIAREKPAPPPPPEAPTRAPAASPMSVPCRNCGATIDITTSKRPIEVMCPSCGEPQLVQ